MLISKKHSVLLFMFIFLFTIFHGSCSASSFSLISLLPDEHSRTILIGLSGKQAWLDKNSIAGQEESFRKMHNLEHFVFGDIDVDNGILQIIRDNGESFYWKSSKITLYKESFKQTAAQTAAREVRWLIHDTDPYKQSPNWPQEAWEYIENQQVFVGMTREMALMSIGAPVKKNKTISTYGNHEQWIYRSQYLYFENNILTTIQN